MPYVCSLNVILRNNNNSRRRWTVQWYSPGCASVHPHVIHASSGPPESKPKRHLDRFSRFCRAHYCDCDRPTDRPRYSVCNNRPHPHTYVVLRCGLIIYAFLSSCKVGTPEAKRLTLFTAVDGHYRREMTLLPALCAYDFILYSSITE